MNSVHIPLNYQKTVLQVVYINFIDILTESLAFCYHYIYIAFTIPAYNGQLLNFPVPQGCWENETKADT